MIRLEFIRGTSRKFWEVGVEGRTLTVRFGRIGSVGRTTTKNLADKIAADRESGRLIRKKEREGYREPRAAPAPKKKAAAPVVLKAVQSGSIGPVLAAMERFIEALQQCGDDGPLFISRRPRTRVTRSAIALFEKKWMRKVPLDVQAFWTSDIPNFSIEGGDGVLYSATHFDGPGPRDATRRKIFAGEAKEHATQVADGSASIPGQIERGRLYTVGIPLVDDENTLVWDCERGGVHQTAGEPSEVPRQAIAPTFTEFLRHYLAAGCFDCGTSDERLFKSYWKLVKSYVPIAIEPRKNLWLQHLKRYYAR